MKNLKRTKSKGRKKKAKTKQQVNQRKPDIETITESTVQDVISTKENATTIVCDTEKQASTILDIGKIDEVQPITNESQSNSNELTKNTSKQVEGNNFMKNSNIFSFYYDNVNVFLRCNRILIYSFSLFQK